MGKHDVGTGGSELVVEGGVEGGAIGGIGHACLGALQGDEGIELLSPVDPAALPAGNNGEPFVVLGFTVKRVVIDPGDIASQCESDPVDRFRCDLSGDSAYSVLEDRLRPRSRVKRCRRKPGRVAGSREQRNLIETQVANGFNRLIGQGSRLLLEAPLSSCTKRACHYLSQRDENERRDEQRDGGFDQGEAVLADSRFLHAASSTVPTQK